MKLSSNKSKTESLSKVEEGFPIPSELPHKNPENYSLGFWGHVGQITKGAAVLGLAVCGYLGLGKLFKWSSSTTSTSSTATYAKTEIKVTYDSSFALQEKSSASDYPQIRHPREGGDISYPQTRHPREGGDPYSREDYFSLGGGAAQLDPACVETQYLASRGITEPY